MWDAHDQGVSATQQGHGGKSQVCAKEASAGQASFAQTWAEREVSPKKP